MTFNRAALIILTPVDWCNVILSDDVSINNVTLWRRNDVILMTLQLTTSRYWTSQYRVCLRDEMAVEKNAKVVRVAVL